MHIAIRALLLRVQHQREAANSEVIPVDDDGKHGPLECLEFAAVLCGQLLRAECAPHDMVLQHCGGECVVSGDPLEGGGVDLCDGLVGRREHRVDLTGLQVIRNLVGLQEGLELRRLLPVLDDRQNGLLHRRVAARSLGVLGRLLGGGGGLLVAGLESGSSGRALTQRDAGGHQHRINHVHNTVRRGNVSLDDGSGLLSVDCDDVALLPDDQ
mmetsp:Transcript_27669/g.68985  ORF Transcript_27669/g.68985 Transcript_27669/m.68985 type:complete len:212 (+) Transcript_27669:1189-1824(+)